jgi:energy-coupling factor transport system substrate-specific component
MKNIAAYLNITVVLMLIFIGLSKGGQENISLFIMLAAALILFFSYFHFEKSSMGTKEIAVIATLSSFAGASRVPFAGLPNIQPTTFLVALSGYVFGPYEGFLVGSTAAFISNMFLGQGPWTPWQMLGWGVVGWISGLLGKGSQVSGGRMSAEKFAFICFFYGFLFDWIMNLWHVLGYIRPLRLESIALVYITGLTFDIMHGAGNFLFAIIFYENLYKVLHRFKLRLQITYIEK